MDITRKNKNLKIYKFIFAILTMLVISFCGKSVNCFALGELTAESGGTIISEIDYVDGTAVEFTRKITDETGNKDYYISVNNCNAILVVDGDLKVSGIRVTGNSILKI